MAAAEAEEDDDARVFKRVINSLVLDSDSSSCIKGDLGESQAGGDGTSVDINKIIVLIILFHGVINLTEEQIRQQLQHPTINTDSLPTIENLAYLSFAPTGLPNIGLIQELDIIKKIVEHDILELIKSSVKSSLQGIEYKSDENIKSKLTDIRSPSSMKSSDIITRACNVCFKVMRSFRSLPSVFSSIVNYRFKGILSVCKNILPSSRWPSDKRNRDDDDATDTKRQQFKTSLSMSYDMCVLLFDDLRRSMKRIDGARFLRICHGVTTQSGKAAVANCGARCRQLHIVKGFGSGGPDEPPLPPFINKWLAYNHDDDEIAEMGVFKINVSIDDSGDVTCDSERYDPLKLMRAIARDQTGNLIWSNVEECIRYCSLNDSNGRPVSHPNNTTMCLLDLSCSGILDGKPKLRDLGSKMAHPGGGKGNKKKPKSTKKTRRKSRTKRIRNKSTNIKHMRNMRNIRKCKNNTKKLKKSRRQ